MISENREFASSCSLRTIDDNLVRNPEEAFLTGSSRPLPTSPPAFHQRDRSIIIPRDCCSTKRASCCARVLCSLGAHRQQPGTHRWLQTGRWELSVRDVYRPGGPLPSFAIGRSRWNANFMPRAGAARHCIAVARYPISPPLRSR
jgi:hypothetical protein